jgi:hypothetical protein
VLCEDELFVLFEAFHGAFALNYEKSVIGAWMAMELVVNPRFVTIKRDVATIRLRWTHVVAPRRLSPLRLFFRVHNLLILSIG